MTKRRFILINMLAFLMIITITVGCIENNETNNGQKKESPVLLMIIFGEYQANYTLEDIEALDAYNGTGAYIKTKLLPEAVVTDDMHEYTGVLMTTLLEQIPDLPENYNISVVSSDGWTTNYTLNEILGYINVYNETGNITSTEIAVMILAYKEDGSYYSEIDPENENGPLRIAFVGNSPIYTPSNLWSKMVVSIEVISRQ